MLPLHFDRIRRTRQLYAKNKHAEALRRREGKTTITPSSEAVFLLFLSASQRLCVLIFGSPIFYLAGIIAGVAAGAETAALIASTKPAEASMPTV